MILTKGHMKISLTLDADVDCLSDCCAAVGELTGQSPRFSTQTTKADNNSIVWNDRITEATGRTIRINARSVHIQKVTVDAEVRCISDVCERETVHVAGLVDTQLQDNTGVSLRSDVGASLELHAWNGTRGDAQYCEKQKRRKRSRRRRGGGGRKIIILRWWWWWWW